MNQNQNRVIIIIIAAIAVMLIFPPFQITYKNGVDFNMGYDWIFNPPKRGSISATVNSQLLLMQWVGVLVVGGLAVLLTKGGSPEVKSNSSNGSNCPPVTTDQPCQNILNSEEIVTKKSNKGTPSGVGGWLLLLVLGMMMLGPLFGAGRINAEIMAAEEYYPNLSLLAEWYTYKCFIWGAFAVAAVLSFYGGWGLAYGIEWSEVSMAKTILWITGPVSTIIIGLLIPMAVFENSNYVNSDLFVSLITSVIGVSVWTLYLSKSKRVRNTYRKI